MTRSEALRRAVEAYCRRWEMLPEGGLVLCAVSGGRDSMALLHLLSAIGERRGFRVAAAHYNHRLRPTADRDEALVRDWCGAHGIPLVCGGGEVKAFAGKTGRSLEDAARTLRYEFLEQAADRLGAECIATAHHREDNAETVLLHLLRGSGLRGLGGIPPVRGRIIRPLLETSRADIDAYISENNIPYGEDETNADPRFTRNRLRLEVLPLLEDIAPGAAERIAGSAALLREDEDHLDREAEGLLPALEDGRAVLPVPLLRKQDGAMGRRLIRAAASRLGVSLSRSQTEAVLSLGSGGIQNLPCGLRAVRKAHQLILEKAPLSPPPQVLRPGDQAWGSWRIRLTRDVPPPPEHPYTVTLRDTGAPVTIAVWDGTGRLAVENGSRTIKRLFADRGIPPEQRDRYPALYREDRCVAILGVAADNGQRPAAGEPILTVSMEPLENLE